MSHKLRQQIYLRFFGCLISGLGSAAAHADVSISGTVNGSTLTISASGKQFAGAVDSLVFRGVQFVNAADHGREIQTAVQYDGFGECWNPTEAGSLADGAGPNSTSVLISIGNAGNVLQTQTNMANWLLPGQAAPDGCGQSSATTAQNPNIVSNTIITKSISIGSGGLQNVIPVTVSLHYPEAHTQVIGEALTAYIPSSFDEFLTYDKNTKSLTGVGAGPNFTGGTLPIIIATGSSLSALAVVSPNPLPGGYYSWYIWRGDASKWSCQFKQLNIPAGSNFTYQCTMVIGNVDEVIAALNAYPTPTANSELPVFRFLLSSGKHFYSLSYDEGSLVTWNSFEETGFRLFPSSNNGSYVPLYRCYDVATNDHFVSRASNCENQSVDGVLGYASPGQVTGLIPLYRFFRNTDHLITTNYNEGVTAGYGFEQILGYVPPQ